MTAEISIKACTIIKYGRSVGRSLITSPAKRAKGKYIPSRQSMKRLSRIKGRNICCAARKKEAMSHASQPFLICNASRGIT